MRSYIATSVPSAGPGAHAFLSKVLGSDPKTSKMIEVIEVPIGWNYKLINDTMEPQFWVCSPGGCKQERAGYRQARDISLEPEHW